MHLNNILNDNIGFISLVDSMGNDLTVVNSARVSFGKRKTELDNNDEKLIAYLAKNKHWSPFRHVSFQFHIKAPELVGRQFFKHLVGCEYTFKDTAWNEISGRYVVYENEFYIPKILRQQSASNKQASTNTPVDNSDILLDTYSNTIDLCYEKYQELVNAGVCKEQARGLLPVSFYTEWYWTASLQAVINFINLRDHDHAQWEIRQYAIAMKQLIENVAPISTKILLEM